jgi:CHC2-type zinc finger protein/Toprim domain-containing protein
MCIRKKRLSCEEANKKDIVDYLSSLGYYSTKIRGHNYWFLSPLRKESTSSFKVDRKQNVWYDHGNGKGGNMVDFGILYYDCSVKEFLEKLNNNLSFHQPIKISSVNDYAKIKIITEKNIVSLSLLKYLKQRKITDDIVAKYCREIVFSMNEKMYSAIGFKNDKGGYELRNEWFKGSNSPKHISTFKNDSKSLAVFEGFFDFLSYQTIQKNDSSIQSNFLVLNSLSFFEKSREFMELHESIHLFLDRGQSGIESTQKALSWDKRYKDESSLYEGHDDLNDWLKQKGNSQRRGLKQKW